MDLLQLFPSDEHPDVLTLFDAGPTQARETPVKAPPCPACGSHDCWCPPGTLALTLGPL